jgi:hypothetical protein
MQNLCECLIVRYLQFNLEFKITPHAQFMNFYLWMYLHFSEFFQYICTNKYY